MISVVGVIVVAVVVVLVVCGVAQIEAPMVYACKCGRETRVGDGHYPCQDLWN